MKKCAHCKEMKPLKNFGLRNRKMPNGEIKIEHNCYCRICNSQRSKDRYYNLKSKGFYFVYRLVNSDDEIIYVGKTESLPTRTNQHFSKNTHLYEKLKNENDLKLQYIAMTYASIMQIREIYYISKYKPKYNSIYKYNEPPIFISDFENDKWLDFEKFDNIVIQDNLGFKNDFLETKTVFKRKRGKRYCVYVEAIHKEGKRKQIKKGSFLNEEDADKLVANIKEHLLGL
ncbi:MAG: GIY-YIG nuclease family protein [Paraclostridium sp.]